MKARTIVACMLLSLLAAPRAVLADGNDFIAVELRVDRPEIAYAGAYRAMLYATPGAVISGDDFTNVWLSLWLDVLPGTYGKSFTQVGLMKRASGFRWFVFAENGFTYCRGTTRYEGLGCEGLVGDIVSESNWYDVELRNIGVSWDAMLYDTVGFPWVLARVNKVSAQIYRATVTVEEGYATAPDPNLFIRNFMYHPRIMVDALSYTFLDWPRSDTGVDFNQDPQRFSRLSSASLPVGLPVCPDHYGATVDLWGDEYIWGAGTGYTTCEALMFWPRAYIPYVKSP